MLCGLPASGKSHYALDLQRIMSNETNEKAVIVSSDNIRKELYGDENIQGNPEEVFKLVHERILSSLDNGLNVIYDATNLKRKYRLGILNKLPKFVKTECHIIWKPIYQCIKDDSNRERSVGEKLLIKWFKDLKYHFTMKGLIILNGLNPTNLIMRTMYLKLENL
jgi:predicted kinase